MSTFLSAWAVNLDVCPIQWHQAPSLDFGRLLGPAILLMPAESQVWLELALYCCRQEMEEETLDELSAVSRVVNLDRLLARAYLLEEATTQMIDVIVRFELSLQHEGRGRMSRSWLTNRLPEMEMPRAWIFWDQYWSNVRALPMM